MWKVSQVECISEAWEINVYSVEGTVALEEGPLEPPLPKRVRCLCACDLLIMMG